METFVDIISDIGAQISKIKRCRINQQTLLNIIVLLYLITAPLLTTVLKVSFFIYTIS